VSRGRSSLAVVGAALAVVVSLDVAAAAGWRPNESHPTAQTLRTETPAEPATTTTLPTTTTVAPPTTTTVAATTTTVVKQSVQPSPTVTRSTPPSSAAFAHVYVVNHFSGAITFSVNDSATFHIAKGAKMGPIDVKPNAGGNDGATVRNAAHPGCGASHIGYWLATGKTTTFTVIVGGGKCFEPGGPFDGPDFNPPRHP
jgi:hypothetical protein